MYEARGSLGGYVVLPDVDPPILDVEKRRPRNRAANQDNIEEPFYSNHAHAILERSSLEVHTVLGARKVATLRIKASPSFKAPKGCRYQNASSRPIQQSPALFRGLNIRERFVVSLYDKTKDTVIVQWEWGYTLIAVNEQPEGHPLRVSVYQDVDHVETLTSDFIPIRTTGPNTAGIGREIWDEEYLPDTAYYVGR